MKKLISIALVLALSGCVNVSESGYYWGDYSHTYYSFLKEPNKETIAKHYESLIDIVETSSEQNLRVPAGIYAELGYIHSQKGEAETALAFYAKEVELYPEAALFIGALIEQQKTQISTKQTKVEEQQS